MMAYNLRSLVHQTLLRDEEEEDFGGEESPVEDNVLDQFSTGSDTSEYTDRQTDRQRVFSLLEPYLREKLENPTHYVPTSGKV